MHVRCCGFFYEGAYSFLGQVQSELDQVSGAREAEGGGREGEGARRVTSRTFETTLQPCCHDYRDMAVVPVAYAQIDWHDFVVVETVDFQVNEVGNLPPPTTPQEVGARVLAQERYEQMTPGVSSWFKCWECANVDVFVTSAGGEPRHNRDGRRIGRRGRSGRPEAATAEARRRHDGARHGRRLGK